jgi:hypothetical protein
MNVNVPRMVLIATGLAVVVAVAARSTATGTYAQHARQAAVSTEDVAHPVASVIDGDPSIPDAAMALRGQPDTRWEAQPATF